MRADRSHVSVQSPQDLPAPVRQYRLQPLRHIFRTRTASPSGPLHKTFMRVTDSELEDVA